MLNDLLTTEELASYLKIHEMTLYKLLQAEEIPAVKVGRSWRFKKEAVNTWLRKKEKGGKTGQAKEKTRLSKQLISPLSDWALAVDMEKSENALFDVFNLKIELAAKVYRPK